VPRPISDAAAFSAFRLIPLWFAAIAQLVEHVIRNDGVTGSSPVCGTSQFVFRVDSLGVENQMAFRAVSQRIKSEILRKTFQWVFSVERPSSTFFQETSSISIEDG
jgi:hypothetical protein